MNRYSSPVVARNQRLQLIRELLDSCEVHSQAELREEIVRRGVSVSQPALSRDLRMLAVVKENGVYRLHDAERVTPLETLRDLLRGAALAGPHLVVLRCEPGAASAVARALEAEEPPGLVGTVAGDDTILAAVSSQSAGRGLRRRVRSLL